VLKYAAYIFIFHNSSETLVVSLISIPVFTYSIDTQSIAASGSNITFGGFIYYYYFWKM